jgi:hypothetical protein
MPYSTFGKYSDLLTFSTFCYSLILKWIKLYFSSIYTQYHKMDIFLMQMYFKNETQHLHMYSDPLLSTFLKHLWQRLQLRVFLGMTLLASTPLLGDFPIHLYRSSQALSGWMGCVAAQLFSGLCRDVQLVQVWALARLLQGHSETCPEVTPAFSWLCA